MRAALLTLALALAGCADGDWIGSPKGYAGVGSVSFSGVSVCSDGAGAGPCLTIGSRSFQGAFFPTLDGTGETLDPPVTICTRYGIEAGTGASVMSAVATGKAAEPGCPR